MLWHKQYVRRLGRMLNVATLLQSLTNFLLHYVCMNA